MLVIVLIILRTCDSSLRIYSDDSVNSLKALGYIKFIMHLKQRYIVRSSRAEIRTAEMVIRCFIHPMCFVWHGSVLAAVRFWQPTLESLVQ